MKNRILFIFPLGKNLPTGGLKVIYDYSNRLVEDGYDVFIAYAAFFESVDNGYCRIIKAICKYIYAKMFYRRNGYTWYNKNSNIHEVYIWSPKFQNVPKADVYIATAVTTAPYVAKYPVNDFRKFYLIQGYESFIINDDGFIRSTYRLKLRKIVISRWLSKIIAAEGENCIIIPNGFDFNTYKLTIPIKDKDKYLVSMLYHINEGKDIGVGLKAIEMAKKEIPQLRLVMFGAYPQPSGLPEWVTYYQRPSIEKHIEINNKAAIYVGSSRKEGWGLTIGEAMICGQAVACTDNDGYKEMATDGVNALMTKVGDINALANSIVKLVKNDQLRYKIANKGMETIKCYDFERSYLLFKDYLTKM